MLRPLCAPYPSLADAPAPAVALVAGALHERLLLACAGSCLRGCICPTRRSGICCRWRTDRCSRSGRDRRPCCFCCSARPFRMRRRCGKALGKVFGPAAHPLAPAGDAATGSLAYFEQDAGLNPAGPQTLTAANRQSSPATVHRDLIDWPGRAQRWPALQPRPGRGWILSSTRGLGSRPTTSRTTSRA